MKVYEVSMTLHRPRKSKTMKHFRLHFFPYPLESETVFRICCSCNRNILPLSFLTESDTVCRRNWTFCYFDPKVRTPLLGDKSELRCSYGPTSRKMPGYMFEHPQSSNLHSVSRLRAFFACLTVVPIGIGKNERGVVRRNFLLMGSRAPDFNTRFFIAIHSSTQNLKTTASIVSPQ